MICGGVAPDGSVRIEVRLQRATDLVEIEQSLAEHRQLRRHANPALGRDLRHLQDEPADLHLLDRRGLLLGHDLADPASEFFAVKILLLLADLDRDIGRLVAMTLCNREQELQQIFLQFRQDAPNHSQIEKRNPVIGRNEDVPRMRISVEKTVHQNLLEISAEKFLGERCAIEIHPHQWTQIGDFFSGHELHRQDTRGGVVRDRSRDNDVREILQLVANSREVGRLRPVIELLQEALAKLLEHLTKLVSPAQLGVMIEELRDLLDRFQVLHHLLANPGPLHFDRDRPPVAQGGTMDLA